MKEIKFINNDLYINEYKFVYKKEPKPYSQQIDAYKLAYDEEYFALFMQQATGKTRVSIDLACNYFIEGKINAVLLVAPNGVQEQWKDEGIFEWSTVETECFLWKLNNSKSYTRELCEFINTPSKKLKWFFVNIDIFSYKKYIQKFKDYCKLHKTMLIIDECTSIKNPESKRTYNITYELNTYALYKRIIKEFTYSTKYRLILTGTMVTNSPFDLFAYFNFLKLNYFDFNYFAFKARYGLLVKDSNEKAGRNYYRNIREDEIKSIKKYYEERKFTIEQLSFMFKTSESNINYILKNNIVNSNYKNLDELKDKIKPFSYIVKLEDCLDLPEKIYTCLYIDMNIEQKRIYNELVKNMESEYSNKEISVSKKVALIVRLQQVTGGFFPYTDIMVLDNGIEKIISTISKAILITNKNVKLDAIIQDMEELANEQIIIWARFKAEIRLIYEYLTKTYKDKRIAHYYGGTPNSERGDVIKDFKNKDIDILIASQQAGGFGLNLQTSHICYYFSNNQDFTLREQSEARVHRPGQKFKCVYKDILCKNTIDIKIYESLKKKKDLLNFFRNNDIKNIMRELGVNDVK
jgi:SNF2 family DNA or RNA helicase